MLVGGRLARVIVIDPLLHVVLSQLGDPPAAANRLCEAAEVEPAFLVRGVRPVLLNPGQVHIKHVADGVVGNVDDLPLRHDLVVLIPRFAFVLAQVDLAFADQDEPPLSLLAKEWFRPSHLKTSQQILVC